MSGRGRVPEVLSAALPRPAGPPGPTGGPGRAQRRRPAGPARPDAAGDAHCERDQLGDDRRGVGEVGVEGLLQQTTGAE
jgi:hypothetical protein